MNAEWNRLADSLMDSTTLVEIQVLELPDLSGPQSDFAWEVHRGSLQGLLFVAGRPVTCEEVARALEVSISEAESLLRRLAEEFHPGGLQVVEVGGGYQMTTRPECVRAVSRFLEPQPQRLSQAALETLALVAYRQPVTLPEIEAVRGVKSDSPVRTLVERGLVEDAGRKDVVGRPILYRTTTDFLLYLGLNSLEDLPGLDMELPDGGE